MVPHNLNWVFGWWLILIAFVAGAGLGLFFQGDDFLGGYTSWPRRLVRLGHIAFAALGMLNVLYGLSPWPLSTDWRADGAGILFIVGAVSMPLICFLSAWNKAFRHLFVVPVSALMLAVIFVLQGAQL